MKHTVLHDCEVYPGYFLAALKNVDTGEVIALERVTDRATGVDGPFDMDTFRDVLEQDLTTGFNSITFDNVMAAAVLAGRTNAELVAIRDALIVEKEPLWAVERNFKFRVPRKWDHIDLIEVAPLDGSLKVYAARLHAKRLQDLPYDPNTWLDDEQRAKVKDYCVNSDIPATELLLSALAEPLALRDEMSIEYRQDLRSKSDAQIAEAVIIRELEKATGRYFKKPETLPGTKYRYTAPDYIRYSTPQFQAMLEAVTGADYIVGLSGKVEIPKAVTGLNLHMGNTSYQMGNGGLHSKEVNSAHHADEPPEQSDLLEKLKAKELVDYAVEVGLSEIEIPTKNPEVLSWIMRYNAYIGERIRINAK